MCTCTPSWQSVKEAQVRCAYGKQRYKSRIHEAQLLRAREQNAHASAGGLCSAHVTHESDACVACATEAACTFNGSIGGHGQAHCAHVCQVGLQLVHALPANSEVWFLLHAALHGMPTAATMLS